MNKPDPKTLALRDLQLPTDAFFTTSTKAKEGLVSDWIESGGWIPRQDGLPRGMILIGDGERDLAWALLMKELLLTGEIVTRVTMADLTMHARHTDTTTHGVVSSLLAKARYPIDQDDAECNTLKFPTHIFIEDFEYKATKDMLNENWTKDAILLLAYYTSVYVRGSSMDALERRHTKGFMEKLTGGSVAALAVLQ